jgi:hypothetical protein
MFSFDEARIVKCPFLSVMVATVVPLMLTVAPERGLLNSSETVPEIEFLFWDCAFFTVSPKVRATCFPFIA